MTDPAKRFERPEVTPLADARRSVACAMSALRAATTLQPGLTERLARVQACLACALHRMERL